MPTLQIAFFRTDAHSTDSVVTYPSANPTQCSVGTEIAPLSLFTSHMGKARTKVILGSFNSHLLRTMLSPLPTFYSCDWLNSFYVTDTLSSTASLNIHLDQYSHPVDGGSIFLQNLNMERLTITQCRNLKDSLHLMNSCCENLKTYTLHILYLYIFCLLCSL